MDIYRRRRGDPANPLPRMKLGLLCRDREIWNEALEQFARASANRRNMAKPVARRASSRTRSRRTPSSRSMAIPRREKSRFAVRSNSTARIRRLCVARRRTQARQAVPQAIAAYEKSHEVSGGHPYPLLNALKLRVPVNGRLALRAGQGRAGARRARARGATIAESPFDKPWCFFDLAQIKLYRGDPKAFWMSA